MSAAERASEASGLVLTSGFLVIQEHSGLILIGLICKTAQKIRTKKKRKSVLGDFKHDPHIPCDKKKRKNVNWFEKKTVSSTKSTG